MDDVQDPAVDSLLRSKLTPPRVPADNVPRPGLQRALTEHADARLLLLCAPAGFGKTTALATLAEQRQQRGDNTAWLFLAAEDDDPARFFTHLIDSLALAVPGFGEQALG